MIPVLETSHFLEGFADVIGDLSGRAFFGSDLKGADFGGDHDRMPAKTTTTIS